MSDEKKGFFKRVGNYLTGTDLYYPTDYSAVPTRKRTSGSSGSAGHSDVTPPPLPSSAPMSVDAAMGMSAVYRAVSILATTVSQLDVGVYRGGSELKTVPATVSQPDLSISGSKFLKRTVMNLATTGNAFWRLRLDPDNRVVNVEVLNSNGVSISYDDDGTKWYHYGNKKFGDKEMKQLQLMEMPGSDWGLGPIQAARTELQGVTNVRLYGDNFFGKGTVPTGVLSSKEYMDGELAKEYQDRFNEMVQRGGGRNVAVLGNGMEFVPMLFSPEDAQFLQSQEFGVTQVARLFGIPANYLLAATPGGTMTYQNMQDVDTAFVRYTLMEYLREIEEAFTSILPRGQKARFKTEGLLRANEKTRAETYKTLIDSGVLTVDEVREMEGRLPLPEGAAKPPVNPTAVEGGTQ